MDECTHTTEELEAVLQATARVLDVCYADAFGDGECKRSTPMAEARMLAGFILRCRLGMTCMDAADLMQRDHSMVTAGKKGYGRLRRYGGGPVRLGYRLDRKTVSQWAQEVIDEAGISARCAG